MAERRIIMMRYGVMMMMNLDLNWKLSPMNKVLKRGLRGDMFTYCRDCKTRSHFEVGDRRHGKRRCTCHNCGRSFRAKLIFDLPGEVR